MQGRMFMGGGDHLISWFQIQAINNDIDPFCCSICQGKFFLFAVIAKQFTAQEKAKKR